MTAWIDANLSGPLATIFGPINAMLAAIDSIALAKLFAALLFILPMIGVFTLLRKEYVHIDRPNPHWYSDLRLWTVVSMLPHIFFYLVF